MLLGHLCHAPCPYLWLTISNEFPKESILWSTHQSVVESRLHAFQEFFDMLLIFTIQEKNHICSRAQHNVPTVLYENLFQPFLSHQLITYLSQHQEMVCSSLIFSDYYAIKFMS